VVLADQCDMAELRLHHQITSQHGFGSFVECQYA